MLSSEDEVSNLQNSQTSDNRSDTSRTHQIANDPTIAPEHKPKRPKHFLSSPAARRKAKELGLDWRAAEGTGPDGRIKERDVHKLAEQVENKTYQANQKDSVLQKKINISPVAWNFAEVVGLDIRLLSNKFPGKRIERADVEVTIRELLAKISVSSNMDNKRRETHREPLTGLRRVISDRMSRSVRESAPVTLTTRADASEIVRIRENLKSEANYPTIPSYNAIFVKILSIALSEFPFINSSIVDDEIVYWESINIGVAVDTERGLIVPVIRNVQMKSLWEITQDMNILLDQAVKGKVLPDELIDGTFTITNLGSYEVDYFTPIINLPECAVLGLGKMEERMVFINGEGKLCRLLPLSLTFDHRLVDGAPAALFLKKIKQLTEKPYLWWQSK